jgi:hypothetical protein
VAAGAGDLAEAEVAPRSAADPREFALHGQTVPMARSYVYLGLQFHCHLRWHAHCKRTVARVRAAAHRISRTLALGVPPLLPVVRRLVLATLVPIATYGSHVWSPIGCPSERALQSAIATPLRIALGLPPSAHLAGVLVECGVADLRALFHRSLLSFVGRVVEAPAHVLREEVMDLVRVGRMSANFGGMPQPLGEYGAARAALFPDLPPLADGARALTSREVVGFDTDGPTLERAALRDAMRRWCDGLDGRDLIAARTGGARPPPFGGALTASARRDGTVDAGVADYLTVFDSKRAAVACARLRFNRSHLADSLSRRAVAGAVAGAPCTRCVVVPPSVAPRDTVEHYLLDCDALGAARVRFRHLFAAVACMPREARVRALLGGPLSPAARKLFGAAPSGVPRASPHLAALGAFYHYLHEHSVTQ